MKNINRKKKKLLIILSSLLFSGALIGSISYLAVSCSSQKSKNKDQPTSTIDDLLNDLENLKKQIKEYNNSLDENQIDKKQELKKLMDEIEQTSNNKNIGVNELKQKIEEWKTKFENIRNSNKNTIEIIEKFNKLIDDIRIFSDSLSESYTTIKQDCNQLINDIKEFIKPFLTKETITDQENSILKENYNNFIDRFNNIKYKKDKLELKNKLNSLKNTTNQNINDNDKNTDTTVSNKIIEEIDKEINSLPENSDNTIGNKLENIDRKIGVLLSLSELEKAYKETNKKLKDLESSNKIDPLTTEERNQFEQFYSEAKIDSKWDDLENSSVEQIQEAISKYKEKVSNKIAELIKNKEIKDDLKTLIDKANTLNKKIENEDSFNENKMVLEKSINAANNSLNENNIEEIKTSKEDLESIYNEIKNKYEEALESIKNELINDKDVIDELLNKLGENPNEEIINELNKFKRDIDTSLEDQNKKISELVDLHNKVSERIKEIAEKHKLNISTLNEILRKYDMLVSDINKFKNSLDNSKEDLINKTSELIDQIITFINPYKSKVSELTPSETELLNTKYDEFVLMFENLKYKNRIIDLNNKIHQLDKKTENKDDTNNTGVDNSINNKVVEELEKVKNDKNQLPEENNSNNNQINNKIDEIEKKIDLLSKLLELEEAYKETNHTLEYKQKEGLIDQLSNEIIDEFSKFYNDAKIEAKYDDLSNSSIELIDQAISNYKQKVTNKITELENFKKNKDALENLIKEATSWKESTIDNDSLFIEEKNQLENELSKAKEILLKGDNNQISQAIEDLENLYKQIKQKYEDKKKQLVNSLSNSKNKIDKLIDNLDQVNNKDKIDELNSLKNDIDNNLSDQSKTVDELKTLEEKVNKKIEEVSDFITNNDKELITKFDKLATEVNNYKDSLTSESSEIIRKATELSKEIRDFIEPYKNKEQLNNQDRNLLNSKYEEFVQKFNNLKYDKQKSELESKIDNLNKEVTNSNNTTDPNIDNSVKDKIVEELNKIIEEKNNLPEDNSSNSISVNEKIDALKNKVDLLTELLKLDNAYKETHKTLKQKQNDGLIDPLTEKDRQEFENYYIEAKKQAHYDDLENSSIEIIRKAVEAYQEKVNNKIRELEQSKTVPNTDLGNYIKEVSAWKTSKLNNDPLLLEEKEKLETAINEAKKSLNATNQEQSLAKEKLETIFNKVKESYNEKRKQEEIKLRDNLTILESIKNQLNTNDTGKISEIENLKALVESTINDNNNAPSKLNELNSTIKQKINQIINEWKEILVEAVRKTKNLPIIRQEFMNDFKTHLSKANEILAEETPTKQSIIDQSSLINDLLSKMNTREEELKAAQNVYNTTLAEYESYIDEYNNKPYAIGEIRDKLIDIKNQNKLSMHNPYLTVEQIEQMTNELNTTKQKLQAKQTKIDKYANSIKENIDLFTKGIQSDLSQIEKLETFNSYNTINKKYNEVKTLLDHLFTKGNNTSLQELADVYYKSSKLFYSYSLNNYHYMFILQQEINKLEANPDYTSDKYDNLQSKKNLKNNVDKIKQLITTEMGAIEIWRTEPFNQSDPGFKWWYEEQFVKLLSSFNRDITNSTN